MKDTKDLDISDLELTASDAGTDVARREQFRLFFDEYVRAPAKILLGDWRSMTGLAILLVYLLMGTFGVMFWTVPYSNQGGRFVRPLQEAQFPLGTDDSGQDILGLMIHATPDMLIMIGAGAVFSTVLATLVGTISGYKGGPIDKVLMVISDVAMTIPGLPLIIVLAAVIEPRNPAFVGIVLSINVWAGLARSLRSQVLTLREHSYVEAARIMDISTPRILGQEVIPNMMPYILINFVNSARNIIFNSVGLYFLGVLPYTNLNWGVVLNQAYNSPALYSPSLMYYIVVPLLTIVFLSFGLILLSQGFDRVFNPRIRAKHTKDGVEGVAGEEGSGDREMSAGVN